MSEDNLVRNLHSFSVRIVNVGWLGVALGGKGGLGDPTPSPSHTS